MRTMTAPRGTSVEGGSEERHVCRVCVCRVCVLERGGQCEAYDGQIWACRREPR